MDNKNQLIYASSHVIRDDEVKKLNNRIRKSLTVIKPKNTQLSISNLNQFAPNLQSDVDKLPNILDQATPTQI